MSDRGMLHHFRRERGPWLLAGLGVAQALWLGLGLRVADLNLCYPFPGGDGYDWLANALALGGEPVRYTARPPLFPLWLLALERLGLSSLFGLLQLLLLTGLALLAERALRKSHGREVSFAVGLFVLANATLRAQALEIMADLLAATLLAAAISALLAARDRRPLYLSAALLAAASALTQQVALLLAPVALLVILSRRRAHLGSRSLWAAAALAACLLGGWALIKLRLVGTAGDYLVRNFSLVELHTSAVGFYARAALSGWGLPALGLMLAGLVAGLRHRPRSEGFLFGCPLFLILIVFFVFLYNWPAERFLLYALVPGLWFLGEGLGALRWRWAQRGAATLAVVVAAWPGWGDLPLTRCQPIRQTPFPEARSVVYLEQPGALSEERYRTLSQLGNTLRRRVRVVPAALYPTDWWGWSCLGAAQEVAEWAVFPWRCPGEERFELVVLRRGTPWHGVLAERAGRLSPQRALAARPAWVGAAELAAAVPSADGWLLAFAGPEPPEWVRALPFVATTSSLFIALPTDEAAVRQSLAAGPLLARRRIGDCVLERRRARGYIVEVVASCGPTAPL